MTAEDNAGSQTSSLPDTYFDSCFLFLVNMQTHRLLSRPSPHTGHRSGLTQPLQYISCVFTCSDFTFPWMLSWDAPRASLASDESETKTESCDKALLPRLIFDLWETGSGRNKQSRGWFFTDSKRKQTKWREAVCRPERVSNLTQIPVKGINKGLPLFTSH